MRILHVFTVVFRVFIVFVAVYYQSAHRQLPCVVRFNSAIVSIPVCMFILLHVQQAI